MYFNQFSHESAIYSLRRGRSNCHLHERTEVAMVISPGARSLSSVLFQRILLENPSTSRSDNKIGRPRSSHRRRLYSLRSNLTPLPAPSSSSCGCSTRRPLCSTPPLPHFLVAFFVQGVPSPSSAAQSKMKSIPTALRISAARRGREAKYFEHGRSMALWMFRFRLWRLPWRL